MCTVGRVGLGEDSSAAVSANGLNSATMTTIHRASTHQTVRAREEHTVQRAVSSQRTLGGRAPLSPTDAPEMVMACARRSEPFAGTSG